MIPGIFTFIKDVISRSLMIFVWLIVLDACTQLDDIPAIVCGVLSLFVFYLVHVHQRLPEGWDHYRLRWVWPQHGLLLLFVSLLVVVGDVFWLFHQKTSDIAYLDDPLDFMVLAILVFPVIEEFGFRLWLQSYVETKMHSILAIVLVSVGFGLLHEPEMPIPQILSGMLYGVALYKTRSVWVPIGIHVIHNGILIISGTFELVQDISAQLMDREGFINLNIAIGAWMLTAIGIFVWVRLCNKSHSVR